MKLILREGQGGWGIFEIFDGDVSKGFLVCSPNGLASVVFPTIEKARIQLKLQMRLPHTPFPQMQPPSDDDDQEPSHGSTYQPS